MPELKIEYHDEGHEALDSPLSRVYMCQSTEQVVINCALGVRYPINDVDALKKAISNSIMIKHPRFSSLIIRDEQGRVHWKRTHVNIDDHFILHQTTTKSGFIYDDNEAAINSFLADISVSIPLSENKPLWELHVLMGLKCVVLRVHHALGDGVSLMSMLSACFGQKKEIGSSVSGDNSMKDQTHQAKREWREKGVRELVKSIWFTFVYVLNLLGRLLWVKDKVTVLSGGGGLELWPRKLVSAKFLLEDFKSIKVVIPKATINDVLLGIISSGLSKYLNVHSPQALQQPLQLTTILPVNLRRDPQVQEVSDLMRTSSSTGLSAWGNKTSSLLLPIHCYNELNPLDHVRVMKIATDKKKQSYEAHFSYWVLKILTSYMGPKVVRWCCYRLLCNTTLLISNIMGPSEEIAIGDNPVTSIKAITMHMVSYAGKAEVQILVAKDIIPDPEFLVKCLQDSFLEMKISIKIK